MDGHISPMRLAQLTRLIAEGRERSFYDWPEWATVRADVFALDRWECSRCREVHRRYRKAALVHHVQHLKERPDLALSLTDPDTGARQLVSLCRACHEEVHPERQWQKVFKREFVTAERWD